MLSLAHKVAASFVSAEEGSERGGVRGTKQKHFVLNVGAVSRVGQLGSLMGFFSVRLLVSFCFCSIKAMGNIVERGRHPRIPEV